MSVSDIAVVIMHPVSARVWRPAPALLAAGLQVETCEAMSKAGHLEVRYGQQLNRYRQAQSRGLNPAQAWQEATS